MFEKNSKFPKFFIYMQLALSLTVLVGMFFSVKLVGAAYFIAIILSAVFLMLDKKYGSALTSYKSTFFLFDLTNLIAIIAIVYYEYKNHSMVLNTFLVILMIIQIFSMLIDVYIVKNKDILDKETVIVDVLKLGSMICILTYFFNVSDLFFAIDAFVFEMVGFVYKIYLSRDKKEKIKENESNQKNIEERIHSAGKNEGEIE